MYDFFSNLHASKIRPFINYYSLLIISNPISVCIDKFLNENISYCFWSVNQRILLLQTFAFKSFEVLPWLDYIFHIQGRKLI